jgi:hypothetical protein
VTCTFAPDAVQVLRQSAVEVPDELAIQLA